MLALWVGPSLVEIFKVKICTWIGVNTIYYNSYKWTLAVSNHCTVILFWPSLNLNFLKKNLSVVQDRRNPLYIFLQNSVNKIKSSSTQLVKLRETKT